MKKIIFFDIDRTLIDYKNGRSHLSTQLKKQ